MQFFKPQNYFEVRKALEQAGQTDLIDSGCDARIPAHPPKEALQARRAQVNGAARGEDVHTIPNAIGRTPNRRSCTGNRRSRRRASTGDRNPFQD
jgi:hypothetical protein